VFEEFRKHFFGKFGQRIRHGKHSASKIPGYAIFACVFAVCELEEFVDEHHCLMWESGVPGVASQEGRLEGARVPPPAAIAVTVAVVRERRLLGKCTQTKSHAKPQRQEEQGSSRLWAMSDFRRGVHKTHKTNRSKFLVTSLIITQADRIEFKVG
jgi:hypothetical protein